MKYRFSDPAGLDMPTDQNGTLWFRMKLKERSVCVECRATLGPGAVAYRPISACDYKKHRICGPCRERGAVGDAKDGGRQ